MTDISSVKVGDKVCTTISRGFDRRIVGLDVGIVDKVTATQITALGRKWMRRGGREFGGSSRWYANHLTVWTENLQANADHGAATERAEIACGEAGDFLRRVRGEDALRIAALLPAELTKMDATDAS